MAKENYGHRLKKIRDELGLTQEQVAEILGVKQPSYANYEYARRKLTHNFILTMNQKFNVNILYLIRGDLPMFEEKSELREPRLAYQRAPVIRVPGLREEARVWQQEAGDMSPVIRPGDYVIAAPVEIAALQANKIYVVEASGTTYTRHAYRAGKHLVLLAHDRSYDPVLLLQKNVKAIYEVRMLLTADLLPRVTEPDLERRVKIIEDFLTNMIRDEEE